ncbi:MAG: prepilin-type N-terminal cleavage/methylation domain-containing protein [Prochlorococcaceae cyanobacterium]
MNRFKIFGRRDGLLLPALVVEAGFSLPELLVAAIIAALVAAATGQVMIGQIIEGRRLEQAQKIKENTSRLNYLIQIEASEAEEILLGQPTDGCGGGNSAFTLFVPKPDGPYAQLGDRTPIHYYNQGSNIVRCGPAVTRDGVLVHTASGDPPDLEVADVVRDAQIVVNQGPVAGSACPVASSARQIVYSLRFPEFPGINPGASAGCVTAHARSVFVCNPPDAGGSLALGDCPVVTP